MLLSCAPTQAEEIFAFLRPPSQMQIAPQAASPTSLNPAREDPDENVQLPARLQRQIVSYSSREAPGTVIIDTTHTYLFYVIGTARRSAMASGSAVKASPGRVSSRLSARANGRIGIRRRR